MGEKSDTPRFSSLLSRWKKGNGGADATEKFQTTAPKKKKSVLALKNEQVIREYKKTFKDKNFKEKPPTRGRSVYDKPAQLQNVFTEKTQGRVSDFTAADFEKSDSEIQMITMTIANSFFFDGVRARDLQTLISAFEPLREKKGATIIKQGEKGDYCYIIARGEVSYFIEGNKVGGAKEGSCFGELALLYSCPRAAMVVVESDTIKLFRVDQTTFRNLLQKQTKKLEAEKMNLLKSVDFLAELDDTDLKRLGAAMSPKQFEPGDSLLKKGDEGNIFYIIKDGTVDFSEVMIGSKSCGDLVLKEGDYFGERALGLKGPRVGVATAATKGTAFSIGKKMIEKVIGKLSRALITVQDRRVIDGMELLSSLTSSQVTELSHLITDKTFGAGETIYNTTEEHEAALYLLREGSVELSGKFDESLGPGTFFGEDMLLLDLRQEATPGKHAPTLLTPDHSAKAVEKCMVGVLSLSDCRTVFDTTKMIDPNMDSTIIEEEEGNESDEDLAAAMAPTSSLNRETTKQWLAKSSKEVLRTVVKSSTKLESFDKHSILGEGQFGEVWLVSVTLPGDLGKQSFALKAQKKDDPTRGNSIAAIKREIDVLGLMDHPYIVNLVHHYEDPSQLYILMGLVHGGELFDVIHTEQEDGTWTSGLPESDSKFYAMVLADTLDYIHRKHFVYRDLKPENVLIDRDGYPVICDFGFAKFVVDKTYTLCGTPNYLSPEVIMNRGHNSSSDHWSLGVLIYEMVAGENPFFYDGMPQMELFQSIVREKFYPLPDDVSDEAFYVIDELLEKDPTQRLGSFAGRGKDIMAKEWFQELDLGQLRQKKHPAPFTPKNTELEKMLERVSLSGPQGDRNSLTHEALKKDRGVGSINLNETHGSLNTGSLLDD